MGRILLAATIGMLVLAQSSFAGTKSGTQTDSQSAQGPTAPRKVLPPLPPPPSGKTTAIGGAIRHVDPVTDQIELKVFGGGKMKILYDQRTRYYRNGVKTPLAELKPDSHASVETVLDGTDIFAVSIHVLSQAPEGEFEGQVLKYDPGDRTLALRTALSGESIELHVPAGTPIVRSGQNASASGSPELAAGELISVRFQSSNNGRGIAKKIAILATPGTRFTFHGTVTFLDLSSGQLAVTDPRDGKRYMISFDPAHLPVSQKLHRGDTVTVAATFSGTHYVADTITIG